MKMEGETRRKREREKETQKRREERGLEHRVWGDGPTPASRRRGAYRPTRYTLSAPRPLCVVLPCSYVPTQCETHEVAVLLYSEYVAVHLSRCFSLFRTSRLTPLVPLVAVRLARFCGSREDPDSLTSSRVQPLKHRVRKETRTGV